MVAHAVQLDVLAIQKESRVRIELERANPERRFIRIDDRAILPNRRDRDVPIRPLTRTHAPELRTADSPARFCNRTGPGGNAKFGRTDGYFASLITSLAIVSGAKNQLLSESGTRGGREAVRMSPTGHLRRLWNHCRQEAAPW